MWLLNVVVPQHWYVEVGSVSESPLEFEITRVNCIFVFQLVLLINPRMSRPFPFLPRKWTSPGLRLLPRVALMSWHMGWISMKFMVIFNLYHSLTTRKQDLTFHAHHYEKTPIQIYWKFYNPKKWKFSDKNSDIFHISAQNTDCGYSLEPPRRGGSNEYPQSMFWAEIWKLVYTPVNPSFTI